MTASAHCSGGSVVYFIRAGSEGSIKIGSTSDLGKRIRELQTGNSVPLLLLGTIPGSRQEEQVVQRMFKHLSMEGEWFRPGEDLLAFIRDHAGPGPREPVTIVNVKFEPRATTWDNETTVFAWVLGSVGIFIGVALWQWTEWSSPFSELILATVAATAFATDVLFWLALRGQAQPSKA